MSEVLTGATTTKIPARRVSPMSDRVKAVQAEALRRFQREGRQLAPLRFGLVAIVIIIALTSKPTIGLSGHHLAFAICFLVFVIEMLGWPIFRPGLHAGNLSWRLGELSIMGASAVALVALQPNGVSEIPGSAVVFIAGVALAPVFALLVGGAVTAGVAIALAVAGSGGGASIAASVLLCAVLAVTGGLLRRYRLSQERTELLLAELEEARDDQARAAAAEERATIARDLHDVLAHSLSGLSIQLEMVRKLTSNVEVSEDVRAAIDAAAALAKQGLIGARDAVGVLRHNDQLGLEELPDLVDHFSRDLHLDVTFAVEGESRGVSPEIGLALYRVAGEALTNVSRHARGASTRVELAFEPTTVRLLVINSAGEPSEHADEGGGWGLAGVRERIRRLNGAVTAGPFGSGWSVVASVPT
ncbi:MAG: histidine kinase [Acidimicrobiales bacterium]